VAVRQLLTARILPPPLNDEHCRACSLRDLCQPEAVAASTARASISTTLFVPED
jgi:CRISPR-associated exonuclease Cas4